MSSIRERLAIALAKKRNGSQAELARACGVKQPSVNDWFSGKTKTLKADSLVKAARYLGVRLEWLQSGLGPMRDIEAINVEVREPAPAWPKWPFTRISQDQWQSLPAEVRGQVEGFALGLIMSHSAGTPPLRDGTTDLGSL